MNSEILKLFLNYIFDRVQGHCNKVTADAKRFITTHKKNQIQIIIQMQIQIYIKAS